MDSILGTFIADPPEIINEDNEVVFNKFRTFDDRDNGCYSVRIESKINNMKMDNHISNMTPISEIDFEEIKRLFSKYQ